MLSLHGLVELFQVNTYAYSTILFGNGSDREAPIGRLSYFHNNVLL